VFYKELYTHKPGGAMPQLVSAENENLQSRYVVQKILEFREQGIPLKEMAVLFRSSFLSFDLEIELTKSNIPFVKFGGFKFVETAHVKDMIAHLRVLENPRDVVSWNRILMLLDGVGPRTAEKIIDDILQRRVGTGTGEAESLPTPRFWMQFNDYADNVQKLFAKLGEVASPNVTPGEKAYHILGYYEPILRARYDDHTKRKKDLEMFQNIAERYKDISALLADLALQPPNESIVDV